MKSLVFTLTTLFIFSSCNKQEQPKPVSLQKTVVPVSTTTVPVAAETGSPASSDDFSDLKKEDDESCDSEEELLKKQIEKAQKAKTQGVKLQGAGDEGCTVN